jgi:hypothetical protein
MFDCRFKEIEELGLNKRKSGKHSDHSSRNVIGRYFCDLQYVSFGDVAFLVLIKLLQSFGRENMHQKNWFQLLSVSGKSISQLQLCHTLSSEYSVGF